MIDKQELQEWMNEVTEAGIKSAMAYLRAKLFPNLPRAELEEHKRELELLLEALS